MGTGNAPFRRKKSRFFAKYCSGKGIDIGYHNDESKVLPAADGYDKRNIPGGIRGDATYMAEIADEAYDWVYSSHCLEHIDNIELALVNWWRILKPGGYLILSVPHRDYYEKKHTLPSVGNRSHKYYFLPFQSVPPDTVCLYDLICSTLQDYYIVYINECSDFVEVPPEWSIEAVIQKGYYTPMFEKEDIWRGE
jgi:SAM-dependent methyltransferase